MPIVTGKFLVQKYPGKGGGTYAAIPEVCKNKNNPLGWLKVKGHIDSFELKQHKLMPMGNGKLFLPVKAEIRKKLKKQHGEYVKIELPNKIMDCFENEPPYIYKNFIAYSDGEKKSILRLDLCCKTIETKAERIA